MIVTRIAITKSNSLSSLPKITLTKLLIFNIISLLSLLKNKKRYTYSIIISIIKKMVSLR